MKKMYKLLYILFGKKLASSDRYILGTISKKIRQFWFKKINYASGNINIDRNVFFGNNISIGNNSGIGINGYIQDNVSIGNDVMIGPDVLIYTSNHKHDSLTISFLKQGITMKPVRIGNNVWIGTRVIILPGVTIGNNVIIGAGSVVTKNIPNNTLAAGNPCIIKKKLGDE